MRLGRGTTVLSAVLTLVAGVGVAVSTAAPAAAAAPTVVVGIGDSYASGEGAGPYDSGTNIPILNMCHRSEFSWQRMATIPNAVGEPRRIHVACSGATTTNVLQGGQFIGEPPQILSVVATDPSVVLVSIGGNDLGFVPLILNCITPFRDCVANGGVAAAEGLIPDVRARVRGVLEAIVAQTPQATVVLAGYPQLLQGACSGFSDTEASALDALSRKVRIAWVGEVMAMRMEGKKVRFVDTIDPFKGHGACSPTPWINNVSTSPIDGQMVVESLHPNSNGYLTYANATSTVLRTDPMRCDARGCRIRFAEESVYYSLAHGTRRVYGGIRDAYQVQGEERGWLGYPRTDTVAVLADGRSQQFTGGTIWWRSGPGAYPVKGRILEKFVAIGDVAAIGTPVSKEIAVPGGVVQNFSSGQMFFKSGTSQAFYSKGEVLKKYRADGTTTGPLGWPRTDFACGLQPGNACRQHFDGSGDSVVYWTSATGAHKVTGAIRDFYASTGWQNSHPDWLTSTVIAGYPTTDAYVSSWLGEPLVMQDFQVGRIVIDIPNTTGQPVCWYMPGRAKPRGVCNYVV